MCNSSSLSSSGRLPFRYTLRLIFACAAAMNAGQPPPLGTPAGSRGAAVGAPSFTARGGRSGGGTVRAGAGWARRRSARRRCGWCARERRRGEERRPTRAARCRVRCVGSGAAAQAALHRLEARDHLVDWRRIGHASPSAPASSPRAPPAESSAGSPRRPSARRGTAVADRRPTATRLAAWSPAPRRPGGR